VAAIRTIESEEGGPTNLALVSRLDKCCYRFGMARARWAGLSKAEPGAGSAGRGAIGAA